MGIEPTTLFGRESEWRFIEREMSRCCNGEARALFLQGHAGMGKSALAHQACAAAQVRGFVVLRSRSWSIPGLAYAPIVDALTRLLRDAALTGGDGLFDGLPQLGHLLPSLGLSPPPPGDHPEFARIQLFEAVVTLIERVCARGPVLWVLDDLHWADANSVELLHYLLNRVDEQPLLALATWRTGLDDPGAALARMHAALEREQRASSIQIGAMSRTAISQLVTSLFEGPVHDGLKAAVCDRSRGSPLFARALVHHLRRGSARQDERGRWKIDAHAFDTVPDEISRFVASLVAEIEGPAREVVQFLAVENGGLEPSILQSATELEPAQLDRVLTHARRSGMVQVEGPRYALSHPLVQQTVLDELSSFERAQAHAKLAKAHEGSLEASLFTIAYHCQHAGAQLAERVWGLDILERACVQAMESLRFDDVVRWGNAALALVSSGDAERSLPLQQRIAFAWLALGEERLASDLLEQVASELLRRGRTLEAVRLNSRRCLLESGAGRFQIAQELMDRSIALLREEDAPDELASTLARGCRTAIRTGNGPWGERMAQELCSRAAPDSLEHAMGQHFLLLRAGRPVAAIQAALHAVTRPGSAALQRDCLSSALAHAGLSQVLLEFDFDPSLAQLHAGGQARDQLIVAWIQLMIQLDRDDLRTVKHNCLGLLADRNAVAKNSKSSVQRMAAMISARMGDLDEARRALAASKSLMAEIPTHREPFRYAAPIYLELASGEFENAADLAEQLGPAHQDCLFTCSTRAEAFARTGRNEAATEILKHIERMFSDVNVAEAHSDRILAILEHRRGDPARAGQLAHRAADQFATSNPYWSNATRLEALEYAAERELPEPAHVESLLHRFTEIGAAPLGARAQGLLREAPRRPDPSPTRKPEHPLSPRELEVAQLVARGLSNHEVGAALFISPHTVATHVKKIYARLEVRKRAELANYMHRSGLCDV